MATHTPSMMMDPSFKSSASTVTTDLFEQMYQHMTPGLMTPLDDWSDPDLLNDFINTTSTLSTDASDILVIPSQQQQLQQQQQSSLVQDTFLTSPCSTKDYFWTCPPPAQDLFNALSTPSISPVMAMPDAAISTGMNDCDDHFNGLIDSLVVPESPPSLDVSPVIDCSLAISPVSSTLPPPPPARQQSISPPLEMIMKLDSPVVSTKKTNTLKRKSTAPPAAQPVACHITSASTPTFVLKQPNRKRPSSSLVDQDTSGTTTTTVGSSSPSSKDGQMVSSELAIKRRRNTDAARRSRLKKLQKMETMAARVAEMESMHQRLLSRVSILESDKSLLLQKETNYVSRIQQLESDLSLAQQKLTYTS